MAKLNQKQGGILSGKLGPLVLAHWKGKAYVRTRPTIDPKKRTAAQKLQRKKFSIVSAFVKTFKPVVDKTFKKLATDRTEMNAAISANMEHTHEEGKNFYIEYPWASISQGKLSCQIAALPSFKKNVVHIHWIPSPNSSKNSNNHRVVLVAYCPRKKQSVYSIGQSNRGSGKASIDVGAFSGERVIVWLAFYCPRTNHASPTNFMGEFNVH